MARAWSSFRAVPKSLSPTATWTALAAGSVQSLNTIYIETRSYQTWSDLSHLRELGRERRANFKRLTELLAGNAFKRLGVLDRLQMQLSNVAFARGSFDRLLDHGQNLCRRHMRLLYRKPP